MDGGSVISEPISAAHRAFAKQKSASMVSLEIHRLFFLHLNIENNTFDIMV